MAANNKKPEVTTSIAEKAIKALKANKLEKIFTTKDGYIFLKECDARAYVGKDGTYTTITEEMEVSDKTGKKEGKEGQGGENKDKTDPNAGKDPLIDEHKKEGE